MIGTNFSADRKYRHTLERELPDPDGLFLGIPNPHAVLFIGCNPSKADESSNDPTVRREVGFAKSWGFGRYLKGNVFALIETDGAKFKRIYEANGVDFANRTWLRAMIDDADLVICAWGALAASIDPAECAHVRAMVPEPKRRVLRLTKGGHPWHPLYLPAKLQPQAWPA